MTESVQKAVLLSRLYDGLVILDAKRFAELVANPVQPRVIRPVKNRVHKAVVEDPYHQAGAGTPVSRATTAEPGLKANHHSGMPICKCGMGYRGVPHPCMRWHHKMMTPEAIKDFTEVVKKHCDGYVPEPTLSLDLLSPDTQAYIAQLVNPKPQSKRDGNETVLLRIVSSVMKEVGFRTDEGERLTYVYSAPDPYGVVEMTVSKNDDPEWVKSFAKKHEEKKSAMPICCASPDPRIAKSGRPYCHSCKKYLDKVPPPQEQTITITRPVITAQEEKK
jgi:hypothetical protein